MPRIVTEGICRGEGHGYVALAIHGYDGPLCLRAKAPNGSELPAKALPLADSPANGTRRVAVVVPLLLCDLALELWLGATRKGRPAWTKVLSVWSSKLSSRLLSTLRPRLAARLREVEDDAGEGHARMRVTGIWPDGLASSEDAPEQEPCLIWHMRVSLPANDSPLELCAFGSHAERLPVQTYALEDRVVSSSDDQDEIERTVELSARVPQRVDHMCLACFVDGKPELTAFRCLLPWQVGRLRDESARHLAGAAWDARYPQWLAQHRATAKELTEQRQSAGALADSTPLMSIVVPVYRTPEPFLEEAIASVAAQSYPRWELVLANASGDWPQLTGVLASALADPRVRLLNIDNRSIAQNTNAGIACATGDYVCFLDHDDLLEPDALWCYVEYLREHPKTDLLYCDEDRIDPNGNPCMPAFKPGPNHRLLLGYNYVTHLLCVSRHALDRTRRSDAEVAGAQDYDLTLRALEVARETAHIPRVLYHWREHEASTAGGAGQKPYAHFAGRKALEGHLARTGLAAHVEDGPFACTYRVRPEAASPAPLASVIVCVEGNREDLQSRVDATLARTTYPNLEMVVVGGANAVGGALDGGDVPVRLVASDEPSVAARANLGARQANGELLAFVDDCTMPQTPYWLDRLADCCAHHDVGVAGARLLFDDGLVQQAGLIAGPQGELCRLGQNLSPAEPGYAYANALGWDVPMTSGACMMVRRSLFLELGGFDERLGMDYAGADLCLRARERGWATTLAPDALVWHYAPASPAREERDDRERFASRHAAYLAQADDAVNPNLDRQSPWFELAE